VSGAAAAFGGASPTGTTAIDALLVAASVAAVVWAGASAPWWVLGGSGAAAVLLARNLWSLALALAAVAAASAVGATRKNWAWLRSVSAGLVLQVLAHSEAGWPFGATVAMAVAVGLLIFVAGLLRRPFAVRRRVYLTLGGLAAIGFVAITGFAVAAASARSSLEQGNRQARDGLRLLNEGHLAEASVALDAAARSFQRADSSLSRPWAWPATLVPFLAQHRNAIVDLSDAAAREVDVAAEALRAIDPERLRLVNGVIDLDAVAGLEAPVITLQASMASLDRTIQAVQSPWLVAPLQRRLADLADELDEYAERSDTFLAAARIAPGLLGADGPRTYFVAFTTPAESRGLGGFMGSYAEIVVDNGRVEVTELGQVHDLNEQGREVTARTVTGPDHFLEHYGRYGFTSAPTGGTSTGAWLNITIPPDFPTVAQVIAQLYPQSGGSAPDGVFALDVFALAALLELTGPISVPGVDEPITAQNAAQFLLKDQYRIADRDTRTDLLESVARETVDVLLTSALPPPVDIGRVLGPQAAQGRLVAWSPQPEVQDFLAKVRMDGALPDAAGGDGVAVAVNNAAASKIDVYLERDISYDVDYDPVTGETTGEMVVTFRNTAPASGLPDYVTNIGPGFDRGTALLLTVVYTQLPVTGSTMDGEPVVLAGGDELGWRRWTTMVAVPPGGERTLRLSMAGVLPPECYRFVTRPQPLNEPENLTLTVTDGDHELLAFSGRSQERKSWLTCHIHDQ
jgi:hypothetical protein